MSAIINASIQAALLSALSNLLAQVLQAHKSNAPLSLDFTPAFQFALYALISTPPNFVWQDWLETAFPANIPTQTDENKNKGDTNPPKSQTRLSKSNTLRKFLLDQLLGGPVNNALFLAAMAGFRGLSAEGVLQHIRAEFIPLSLASYKLWPLVSIIGFMFIPVERRVLFGGLVALGWNVYLSLLMAG